MVWRAAAGLIALFVVQRTFLPKLYELKMYSIYTYIELRFDSPLITNITLFVGLGALFFHLMALSFLTALAFSTVISVPVWINLLLLNTIATIYTMCGGMKAVIWTDCLQCFVMMFSVTFICIKLWSILGADHIFKITEQAKGNQWKEFDLNFAQRTSSWGYFFMEYFYVWSRVGFGQYYMQRCIACRKDHQRSEKP